MWYKECQIFLIFWSTILLWRFGTVYTYVRMYVWLYGSMCVYGWDPLYKMNEVSDHTCRMGHSMKNFHPLTSVTHFFVTHHLSMGLLLFFCHYWLEKEGRKWKRKKWLVITFASLLGGERGGGREEGGREGGNFVITSVSLLSRQREREREREGGREGKR